MRTLAGYLIGVIVVLAIVNGVGWYAQLPQRRNLTVFSIGFVLGALGMLLAGYIYNYRKVG